MSDLLEIWLDKHPHVCGYLFVLLIFPTIHLYTQTFNIRRVFGMRPGDGWWLKRPRHGGGLPRKSKSHPPFIDNDRTPPA